MFIFDTNNIPNIQIHHSDFPDGDFLHVSDESQSVISNLQNIGLVPISVFFILYCFAYVITVDELVLPFSGQLKSVSELKLQSDIKKKVLAARAEFMKSVISQLKFGVKNRKLYVMFRYGDIANIIFEKKFNLRDVVDEIVKYSSVVGYATKVLQELSHTTVGLVIFVSKKNLNKDVPLIFVCNDAPQTGGLYNARYVTSNALLQTVSELIFHCDTVKNLSPVISGGFTNTVNAFSVRNWPRFPLMSAIKKMRRSRSVCICQQNTNFV